MVKHVCVFLCFQVVENGNVCLSGAYVDLHPGAVQQSSTSEV